MENDLELITEAKALPPTWTLLVHFLFLFSFHYQFDKFNILDDTSHLLASSGAYSAWIWDVETGKLVHKIAVSGPARRCGWSFSGNLFFVSFDCVGARASNPSELLVFDVRDLSNLGPDGPVPVWRRPIENSKLTAATWAHLDDRIITGHENGDVCLFDLSVSG